MLQQTALILAAGLIFLFFFTPNSEEVQTASSILTISLLSVLTFAPGLLSYFFGKRAIKRLSSDRDKQIKQLQNSARYTLLFGIMVLAGFIFEIYYLELPVLVDRKFAFWKFENSRILINIIPLIIAVLLTRLAIFELDRQVRNTSWTRRKFLIINLKLMLFPVLPFMVYLPIGDFIDHSPLVTRVFFIAHPYIYWIIVLLIIAAMYIKAPAFLRGIWATHSLQAGEVRDRIELLASRENIKYRDVSIWNMEGGKIANAGVAGLLPRSRYVFLTDSLLDNFTADEIETIVAHEFGHIKYRHVLSYLIFSFGYLAFYGFLYIRFIPVIEELNISNALIAFLGALMTIFAFYTYFIFIFRYLSRKFERQADLYAVDTTGKPEVFKSALIRLAAINYIPHQIPRLIELIRTHPSVYYRLQLIDRAADGDTEVLKYRQPVFNINKAAILVVMALLLLIAAEKDSLFPPAEVHYEIGRQYAIEGMTDEAIREFKEAARADPKSGGIHYALGILYAEKGVVEEAVKELKKELEINPKSTAARERLKKILENPKKPKL